MITQTITIPEYILRVKLSDKRMPTYFIEGNNIPKKFKTPQYIFKEKKYRHSTKRLLFDTQSKLFIRKNAALANKPRYITIGGNMLYAGMKEHVRMKMIMAIKDDFRRYIQALDRIDVFPIHITAELHTKPNECNWDIDNLWIYVKVFQDLLIEYGIIPDDCVKYITKSTSFEFYPIAKYEDRKMIFHIQSDQRSIINHVMFRNSPVPITYVRGQYASLEPAIYIVVRTMKSGSSSLSREGLHFTCSIGIGKKKLLYGELSTVLYQVRYEAVQHNVDVVIDQRLGTEFYNYDSDKVTALIVKYLSNEGIKVIIHNT